MPLNAQILLSIVAHETASGDISRTLRATPATYSLSLADGTGANQSQVVWSDSRTVPGGGEDSFPLRQLVDDRGTITFTSIKALLIRNTHPSILVKLVLGDGYQEAWSNGPGYAGDVSGGSEYGETLIVPGGCLFYANPSADGAEVASSEDNIYIIGPAGGTYDIILIGEGTIT